MMGYWNDGILQKTRTNISFFHHASIPSQTGRFFNGTYELYSGAGWTSAPSALASMFNGVSAVPNRYARVNTNVDSLTPNTIIGTIDWTVELIVRLDGYFNCTFFEWAATRPPETTSGTWIKIGWGSASQTLSVRLRCDGQTISDAESTFFSGLPRDGQWHHVALVKEGSKLSAYVDYQFWEAYYGGPIAGGNYSFATSSRAYIGQNHAGGDRARSGIGFDEIRFSNSVELDDFLRVDKPFFSAPPVVNLLTADLTFVGTPWVPSLIERKANLGPGTWTSCGWFTTPVGYIGKERTVNVPKPSSMKGFYKIR